MRNPNRRCFLEDTLFVLALAIPAVIATARYFDSEAEKTTLARSQEARTAAVARAATAQQRHMLRADEAPWTDAMLTAVSAEQRVVNASRGPR